MLFSTSAIAVLGLATYANAHMMMSTPVPFGKSSLTNSPLAADGSDFPCKQRSGVYSAEGASNTIALGSTQPLTFIGSAVHGGGSCQISITYDAAPTKNSVWKVIHSIEGGCPARNQAGNLPDNAAGADPDTYTFPVPTTLPTGSAVLAWTWFNKVGNREMYMNCAPITITGGSSKRTDAEELVVRNITQLMERDQNAYNALPDMFIANIGNGCTSVDSADVLFPNPGDSVEQDGLATKSALQKPTGASCGSAVAGAAATPGTGSAATSAAPVAVTPAPAASQGGVFATIALPSTPAAAPTVAVSAAPVSPVAASPVAASPPAASSAAPVTPATTGSGSTMSGACTDEGAWNCIGGTTFQRCASGTWSVVMPLAAGTSCTAGISTNINIVAAAKAKREVRFSSAHVRRHLRRSS